MARPISTRRWISAWLVPADGPVYEILDENHAVVATFGMAEFKALEAAQATRCG